MRSSWVLAFGLGLLLTGPGRFAQAQEQDLDYVPKSSEYITIDEGPATSSASSSATDMSPLPHFSAPHILKKINSSMLSLLKWILHEDVPDIPYEKYNRTHHFGRWINDPDDETCFNTRAKVLIRDSEAPVSFREKNHCVVDTGAWADPYAGEEITQSREIQIDHMVPLKNAYISGAWEWDYQTRCLYANFLGNQFHLISVSGRENMRKSDKAPDKYLPPNFAYRCEYLENWLKIKLIWRLRLTRSEVEAIRDALEENACDRRSFFLPWRELATQRRLIQELHSEVCPGR